MNQIFKKALMIGFGVILAWPTLAQDNIYSGNVAQRFSGYDPNSQVKINHQPLSDILAVSVFPVGRSYRILGSEKPDTYSGSRIKTGKQLSPSRYEGNRILIHAFNEDHKEFFEGYKQGLERLSKRRPLSDFNQREQMAYWLNLYNVIVINKLIEEYPISNTKSLRGSGRGKSFWDEKVTTVEGVPLSLRDIEKILFTNFNKPELVFGLWQGNVGGPRLSNFAYTANNLDRALEVNAVEFVNSNRGLRPPTGNRMKVSDFYEWMMPAFGPSERQVLMFIQKYADPNFVTGVGSVSEISFKIYDWSVADLMGGTRHSGQHNQYGGVQASSGGLGSRNGDLVGQPGGLANGVQPQFGRSKAGPSQFDDSIPGVGASISATPGATGSTVAVGDVLSSLRRVLDMDQSQMTGAMADLLIGIQMNNRRPIPVITVEECAPGEVCEIERVNSPEAS